MGDVIKLKANDSLRSVVAGLGDPGRDKAASVYYGSQFLDDFQLLNIYRSNWLGRKIIEIPAMDAIRKGRDWQAKQNQIEKIEGEQNRLGFYQKLLEVKIKARLWGGAAIYIGTGDADLSAPLDPRSIIRGGVKYLTVMSRREIVSGPLEYDVTSEFYGKPAYYDVIGPGKMVRLHPSRLVVFIGAAHADPALVWSPNQGWGDSILEAVYSAVRNADSTAANIASLVFEANVDVFRIPDFMNNLSDPDYAARLMQRFALAATAKGINRALILDKDEEYERRQVSFAQLPEVMQSFLQMAAGAADIPVTRLLGQSPAGMSATGESDMNNYYDRISSIQTLELTSALYRFDECLIRSALGSRPAGIFYTWAPLKQMTEKEKSDIANINAETADIWATTGLFSPEELRKVATNQLVESNFYPGIDQAVAETDAKGDFKPGQPVGTVTKDPTIKPDTKIKDATPRTLYVSRKVVNAKALIKWAKGQGFTTTLAADDLHVTIAHSRAPVDWMKVGESWTSELKVAAGGPRLIEQFGEATVLLFKAADLDWRHQSIINAGATWDHPEYQSHITISYGGAPLDLSTVEPYQGEIVLGPETFAEVEE
jgi:phage-related protein (TIGR01555 family)